MSKRSVKDTNAKCRRILEEIIRRTNMVDRESDIAVAFSPNFGGNTLTVLFKSGEGHTHQHIGQRRDSFEDLIDQMELIFEK